MTPFNPVLSLSPVPPVSLSNSNTLTIVNLFFHGLIRVFLYPLFILIDRLLVCTYSYKPHSITVWRWNGKLISKAFLASCNCFWYDVRLKYFQFGVESNPALHSFCCEFIYDWCTNARLKPITNCRATSLDFPLAHCSIFLFFFLGVVITFILWCSFKDAWTLARILDSKDSWIELGKKAIYHLDIELGELNKAYFRICYG